MSTLWRVRSMGLLANHTACWLYPTRLTRPLSIGRTGSTNKQDLQRRFSAMALDMLISLLWKGLLETAHMVFVSSLVGTLIGLPIGVFLATSNRGELFP